MPLEYSVDEFIGEDVDCTLEEEVDKNVSLLYDFCMLCKKGTSQDSREQAVRQLLNAYTTADQMHNAVRDVVVGNLTLNQLLKRKGYLQ